MKKLLFSLFALAIVYHDAEVDLVSSAPIITANYDVIFVGTDVPQGYLGQTVSLTGSPLALSSTTINAGVASAIRSKATSDGFTVPANQVIMHAWTAQ